MNKLDAFIDAVSSFQSKRIFNPWSQCCRLDVHPDFYLQRREFLKAHLSCPDPVCAIIGEAPGWRGARYSGVAFTSEQLIYDHAIPRVALASGDRITTQPNPLKEPSATIVWQGIYRNKIQDRVVMFNAVPWHPEGKESPLSNRTPNESEKKAGVERLELFFDLFPGVPVMALGLTASENLKKLHIAHTKLRHPANGGAPLFKLGMENFIKKLSRI